MIRMEQPKTPVAGRSSSVERAFDILERIARAGGAGITLAELAAEIPTAKSTTHRYVATLIGRGAVRRDELGRLHLGLKLVELAGSLLEGDDLGSAATPVLHQLAARTGETVHLGTLSDGEIVYIAKVESPHSVRLVSRLGARIPLYCSAMGKAVFVHLDAPGQAAAFAVPREARTEHTKVTEAALRRELDVVREAGVAIDDEENEIGVRCIGAAILGAAGNVLGAISVSAPEVRMSHARCNELTPTVIAAAEEIARRMGRAVPYVQNNTR
jgi:DNA-binding IclR family transcriptional regulator